MKLPIILLASVLFIALCNLGLDLRQPVRFRPLAASAGVETGDAAFQTRLAASDDPADLRTLARREHDRLLELRGWTRRLRDALDLLNGARLLRNITLLILATGALIAVWRAGRPQGFPR